ncbi:hypothetical protein MDOR_14240 [Mycolicibacterium doricum]|uniref:Uncharacterized protein n=1 Tax=Mycolicibacterium doricum TaxID=126673 RepID=A0A7I7VS89_9MYCO|nr:hypothetical protein MDOR_14240 [Mycolicibacterium doricum]
MLQASSGIWSSIAFSRMRFSATNGTSDRDPAAPRRRHPGGADLEDFPQPPGVFDLVARHSPFGRQ